MGCVVTRVDEWSMLPDLVDSGDVPKLLDAIKDVKGQGLMGSRVIHTFIGHRVLPLKMRHHP
jgi:hypothetical protein